MMFRLVPLFEADGGGGEDVGVEPGYSPNSDLAILEEGGDEAWSNYDPKESAKSGDEDLEGAEEEEPEEESGEESESSDESKEEDKEGEEENEEDKEPELDDDEKKADDYAEAQGRPTFKALKTEFPTLFKRFPQLRTVVFREEAYTGVFPTVDDAKDASGRLDSLEKSRQTLFSGDPGDLIKTVIEENPDGALKLARGFFSELNKTDDNLYWEAASPLLYGLVKQLENVDKETAQRVNQFVFGTDKIGTIANRAPSDPKLDAERKDLEAKKDDFQEKIYTRNHKEISDTYFSSLRRAVSAQIRKSVPDATPYVHRAMINDAVDEIGRSMESDSRHMATMGSLWKRGVRDGFEGDSKARILRALLGRARIASTKAIAVVRAESNKQAETKAKKGATKKLDEETIKTRRKREPSTNSRNQSRPPKDQSDLEFLQS
jgi:hypothetical protein